VCACCFRAPRDGPRRKGCRLGVPVAVCCSVLQCVAVRCSVLQCVVVCCSVSSELCPAHQCLVAGSFKQDVV